MDGERMAGCAEADEVKDFCVSPMASRFQVGALVVESLNSLCTRWVIRNDCGHLLMTDGLWGGQTATASMGAVRFFGSASDAVQMALSLHGAGRDSESELRTVEFNLNAVGVPVVNEHGVAMPVAGRVAWVLDKLYLAYGQLIDERAGCLSDVENAVYARLWQVYVHLHGDEPGVKG